MNRQLWLVVALIFALCVVAVGQAAPRNSASDAQKSRRSRKAAETPKKQSEKTAETQAEGGKREAAPGAVVPAEPQATAPVALPATSASRIGVVQMNRVEQEYSALQDENEKLDAWRRDKQGFLANLKLYVFLTDDEFLELMKLLENGQLSDKDRARYQALKDQNLSRDREWGELQKKVTRTEAEEGRFAELRQLYESGRRRHQMKRDELNREFERRLNETVQRLLEKVRGFVGAVAQEQGLEVVLDSEYVLYGGRDITEAVIAKIKAAEQGTGKGAGGAK